MSVVCFASWLVNQKHFNIMELFKREITLQKIHYAQTEKVMKFCWSWSNFTPFKTKLHCLIISNRLLINSSLSQPNSVEIFLLNFNFHYALDKWCNSQISAEVTVSLGGWAKHAQGTLTAVTGFQKSSVHLELWKLYTYLFVWGALLSKWKLQLLNTSWNRSLIFVLDGSFSFSQTQIPLLRRRLSFNLYNFKFPICILSMWH